ncbi:MAG: hypothetical protein LRY71_12920 [Bacillaceae bacterium]|nr:hypothetical protein [Bacillaceae bacterium]
MVNRNHEKVAEMHQKHKSAHLGGDTSRMKQIDSDGDDNDAISVGAEGRKLKGK